MLTIPTLLLILLVALCGCQSADRNLGSEAGASTTQGAMTTAAEAEAELPPGAIGGEVIQTMDSGGYTYVLIDTGSERLWAAGPETEVGAGQRVVMPTSMVMTDFHSKTLDRTFQTIHFVGAIEVAGHTHEAEPAAASPHGAATSGAPVGGSHTQTLKTGDIAVERAAGGHTVAEVHGKKAELAGQAVTVRGQVVKFTANIMGTNWVHLQDGTGDEQTCDLTVTTSARPEVGDVITISGPLTVDRDFGAGYFYPVIIENATVKTE